MPAQSSNCYGTKWRFRAPWMASLCLQNTNSCLRQCYYPSKGTWSYLFFSVISGGLRFHSAIKKIMLWRSLKRLFSTFGSSTVLLKSLRKNVKKYQAGPSLLGDRRRTMLTRRRIADQHCLCWPSSAWLKHTADPHPHHTPTVTLEYRSVLLITSSPVHQRRMTSMPQRLRPYSGPSLPVLYSSPTAYGRLVNHRAMKGGEQLRVWTWAGKRCHPGNLR